MRLVLQSFIARACVPGICTACVGACHSPSRVPSCSSVLEGITVTECCRFTEPDGTVSDKNAVVVWLHCYTQRAMMHLLAGTETQRILVANMRRLADTSAMAAFDAKGRCLYANTPLASMLGFKLKDMRTKDISQLLPQPYGALHMKWIKVQSAT